MPQRIRMTYEHGEGVMPYNIAFQPSEIAYSLSYFNIAPRQFPMFHVKKNNAPIRDLKKHQTVSGVLQSIFWSDQNNYYKQIVKRMAQGALCGYVAGWAFKYQYFSGPKLIIQARRTIVNTFTSLNLSYQNWTSFGAFMGIVKFLIYDSYVMAVLHADHRSRAMSFFLSGLLGGSCGLIFYHPYAFIPGFMFGAYVYWCMRLVHTRTYYRGTAFAFPVRDEKIRYNLLRDDKELELARLRALYKGRALLPLIE